MGKRAGRIYVDDETGKVLVQVGSQEVGRVAMGCSPDAVLAALEELEEEEEEDGEDEGGEDDEDEGEEDGEGEGEEDGEDD